MFRSHSTKRQVVWTLDLRTQPPHLVLHRIVEFLFFRKSHQRRRGPVLLLRHSTIRRAKLLA